MGVDSVTEACVVRAVGLGVYRAWCLELTAAEGQQRVAQQADAVLERREVLAAQDDDRLTDIRGAHLVEQSFWADAVVKLQNVANYAASPEGLLQSVATAAGYAFAM